MKITPMHTDGMLYVLIAVSGAAIVTFTDKDVAMLLPVWAIMLGKIVAEWTLAGSTALKTYRSTAYSDSKKAGLTTADNTDAFFKQKFEQKHITAQPTTPPQQ